MLSEGLDRIYVTPIVALGPAIAITLGALSFVLFGEVLAKAAAGGGSSCGGSAPSFAPSPLRRRCRPRATAVGSRSPTCSRSRT